MLHLLLYTSVLCGCGRVRVRYTLQSTLRFQSFYSRLRQFALYTRAEGFKTGESIGCFRSSPETVTTSSPLSTAACPPPNNHDPGEQTAAAAAAAAVLWASALAPSTLLVCSLAQPPELRADPGEVAVSLWHLLQAPPHGLSALFIDPKERAQLEREGGRLSLLCRSLRLVRGDRCGCHFVVTTAIIIIVKDIVSREDIDIRKEKEKEK